MRPGLAAVLAVAGFVAIALLPAAVVRDRRGDCTRLLKTAELAAGSRVQPTLFGGCRVVTFAAIRDSAPPSDAPTAIADSVTGPGLGAPPRSPGAAPTSSRKILTNVRAPAQDAIDAEKSAELSRCLATGDAARGVSVAMGGCVAAELQAQDGRLNTAYRVAMDRLDEAGKARLRAGELVWMRKRDEGCAEEATGGTIDMVDIPGCLLDETISRRLVLEAMAS